jgi:pyruvate dehydrogenase E2 component (dihydrolipoamide acetyltransferase)
MDMTPTDNGVLATPVARKLAVKSGVDLTTVLGSGPQGKITKKDVQAATAVDSAGPPDKVYATPAARRVALEGNVALERVTGSGPDGRIQAADVVAAAARTAAVTPLVARRDAAPEVTIIPLRGKRKVISERMTASYQSIPHINFTARVDMARFNETRAELNAHADTSGSTRVSATALMVKCVAQTLLRHPWLNSSFQEDEIYLYRDVSIGVAVALEDGLIVPVVHNAAQKNVAQIAVEVADLASRAKDGQLTPADVHGGTFTLSNLGPFGVEQFTAIINPPQAAVLAAGVIQPEVVPDAQEQVAVRPMMHMTLSVDHRVVDGAVAAHFIADLKSVLVLPLLLL